MKSKPIRQQYYCTRLKATVNLKLKAIYESNDQIRSPILLQTQFEDCDSKNLCKIKRPDGSYDLNLCPACITLNKGGNL